MTNNIMLGPAKQARLAKVEKWELWMLQLGPHSDSHTLIRHSCCAIALWPDAAELVYRDASGAQTLLADVPQVLLDLAPAVDPREATYSFWRAPINVDEVGGMDNAYRGVTVIEYHGTVVVKDADEIRRMLYEYRPARRGSREHTIYLDWLAELLAQLQEQAGPARVTAGTPHAGE